MNATQIKPESDDGDIAMELNGAQQKVEQRRASRLAASQCMQWRWMWRALFGSLFEPYVVNIFLKGTWLFNTWLRLMGADVSMGALILGKVSDHGLVKVKDTALVGCTCESENLLSRRWFDMIPLTVSAHAA